MQPMQREPGLGIRLCYRLTAPMAKNCLFHVCASAARAWPFADASLCLPFQPHSGTFPKSTPALHDTCMEARAVPAPTPCPSMRCLPGAVALSCSTRSLLLVGFELFEQHVGSSSLTRIEPGPLAWRVRNHSHWITREVPDILCLWN